MTDWLQTAETGIAVGTDVTVGNSNDGTAGFAFSGVTVANGATLKYTTGLADSLAYQAVGEVSGQIARAEISSLFSTTTLVWDVEFMLPALPGTADCRVFELFSGTTFALRIAIGVDGKIRALSVGNVSLWTSAAIVPTGSPFRLGVRAQQGATTTTGTFEIAYYSTRTATVATEKSAVITNANLLTTATPFNVLWLGKVSSTGTGTVVFDNIQLSDTRTALFNAPAVTGGSAPPPTGGTGTEVDLLNSFDNGAVGQGVTAAGSVGGGFALSAVTVANGGTVTYVGGMTGAAGVEFAATVTGQIARIETAGLFNSTVLVWDVEVFMSAYPAATVRMFELFSGATFALRVGMDSAGIITVYNAANGAVWNSTTPVPLNTVFRIGMRAEQGASSVDGKLLVAIYPTRTATQASSSTNISGVNLLTTATPFTNLMVGKLSSASTWTFAVDNLRLSPTRAALYSGAVSNVSPTVNLVGRSDQWTIDGRTSTPAAGGTLTYTISPSTGVIELTEGVFSGAQSSVAVTYTVVATESGTNRTATKTYQVPARVLAGAGYTETVVKGTDF